MPRKNPINKQLTAGRPRSALNKGDLPEMSGLPKKIMGSHMGMMQSNNEGPPQVKGPALGKAPKLPPRPRKAPPV